MILLHHVVKFNTLTYWQMCFGTIFVALDLYILQITDCRVLFMLISNKYSALSRIFSNRK